MPDDAALAEWLDKLAIQELIARYTSAATRGDWDALEALFAPDATLVLGPPFEMTAEGARAIREMLAAQVDPQDFFLQMTHDSVVALLGDGRATGVTTIHALARRAGQTQVTSYALYYDDFVEVDGAWSFARRRLQPIFVSPSALDGDAPISRTALRQAEQP